MTCWQPEKLKPFFLFFSLFFFLGRKIQGSSCPFWFDGFHGLSSKVSLVWAMNDHCFLLLFHFVCFLLCTHGSMREQNDEGWGETPVSFAGAFFVMGSCWFADHCLETSHVRDLFSAGFQVWLRPEKTLVIQRRHSDTKVWFPNPLFAHGLSCNLPKSATVFDWAQGPFPLRFSSCGETVKQFLLAWIHYF